MYYFDVHWQWFSKSFESLENVQPAQDRAFVIAGTSAIKFAIFFGEDERLGIPSISNHSGLDVEVPINQNGFFVGVVSKISKEYRGKGNDVTIWKSFVSQRSYFGRCAHFLQLCLHPPYHFHDIIASMLPG